MLHDGNIEVLPTEKVISSNGFDLKLALVNLDNTDVSRASTNIKD